MHMQCILHNNFKKLFKEEKNRSIFVTKKVAMVEMYYFKRSPGEANNKNSNRK